MKQKYALDTPLKTNDGEAVEYTEGEPFCVPQAVFTVIDNSEWAMKLEGTTKRRLMQVEAKLQGEGPYELLPADIKVIEACLWDSKIFGPRTAQTLFDTITPIKEEDDA